MVLYSTHCPKCKVLAKKLNDLGIDYVEENNIETMQLLGITEVPMLEVDEKLLDFAEAVKLVNKGEIK